MTRSVSFGRLFAALLIACAAFVGTALAAPTAAYADDGEQEAVTLYDLKPVVGTVLSTSAGKLTVSLSGSITDAEGYTYEAALNKAFTKGLKTVDTTATSATFKGLKKGKKYYVRVQAYAIIDQVLYYSNWSDVASGKVGIKLSKSKAKGTWKLLKSTDKTEQTKIKNNKKAYPNAKYTVKLATNGKVTMKDYDGTKYKAKWVATSAKAGTILTESGEKAATYKYKSKTKLVISWNDKSKWTLSKQ